MTDYLIYSLVGAIVLIIVEAGIWMNVCLGLSMKHREANLTRMMLRAPYRVLWPPKLFIQISGIALFSLAAKYYRTGGQELTLAIIFFSVLSVLGVLVFYESFRAVQRYEELSN